MTKYILATKGVDGLALGYDGHGFTRLPSSFAKYPADEIERRRKLVADQFGVDVEAVEVGSMRERDLFSRASFAEDDPLTMPLSQYAALVAKEIADSLNRNVRREVDAKGKKRQ